MANKKLKVQMSVAGNHTENVEATNEALRRIKILEDKVKLSEQEILDKIQAAEQAEVEEKDKRVIAAAKARGSK